MPSYTSYNINWTDDSVKAPIVINPGIHDKNTSLDLYGMGAVGYGEGFNESLIHLLENFCSPNPPRRPTQGQMWYNSNAQVFKVQSGEAGDLYELIRAAELSNVNPAIWGPANVDPSLVTWAALYDHARRQGWESINKVDSTTTEPDDGTLAWYDPAVDELKVYNGTSYDLVGKNYLRLDGNNDALISGSQTFSSNVLLQSELLTKTGTVGSNVNAVHLDNLGNTDLSTDLNAHDMGMVSVDNITMIIDSLNGGSTNKFVIGSRANSVSSVDFNPIMTISDAGMVIHQGGASIGSTTAVVDFNAIGTSTLNGLSSTQIINMTANRIINVGAPVNNADAVRKIDLDTVEADLLTAINSGSGGTGAALTSHIDAAQDPHPNASSSSATPNKIAIRDSSGDIETRLIRSTYPTQNTILPNASVALRVNDSTDNYWRPVNKDGFRDWLGNVATADDSLLLDGAPASVPTADDTIMKRDGSGIGYAFTMQLSQPEESSPPSHIWIDVNSNGILFPQTIAQFRSNTGTAGDGDTIGSMTASNWWNSTGNTGWRNTTHQGGIFMDDATWVKVWNDKDFFVNGNIAATEEISAYYSDERLKENMRPIDDALAIVTSLTGYRYNANELANKLAGYDQNKQEIGLSAQQVKEVLPEAVKIAPFDLDENKQSKSGEDYLTLNYERLVPVLIEAIKELSADVEDLKTQLALTKK